MERIDSDNVGNYFNLGSIVEHLVLGGVMEHVGCGRVV